MTACFVCFFGYIEYARDEGCRAMSRTTTMTVRIGGALSDFVSANVGDEGSYENVSEYIRDLIRRDKERAESEAFNRLKAELTHAFAAPEETYKPLTAAEVIARNQG
jgi:antitoxin ParD1/3/4